MKRREYYEFTNVNHPTVLTLVAVDQVKLLVKNSSKHEGPTIMYGEHPMQLDEGVVVRVVELTADEALQLTKMPRKPEYKKQEL